MFGSRSKQHVFKPTSYGYPRRSRRIPRWLVLMLTGVVLGAGGLLFLQTSYGPQRLTVEQSEQLHRDLNSANMEKQRLQTQVNQQTEELSQLKAQLQSQSDQLRQANEHVVTVNEDLQLFAAAMPPDPRGTSPGIRAASFANADGHLDYRFLVMQDEGKTDTFKGTVELVVSGVYPNGRSANIDLESFDISLERYVHMRGRQELPAGFSARQATVRIKQDGGNRVNATRTLRVSR
jgi:hypothetical protein